MIVSITVVVVVVVVVVIIIIISIIITVFFETFCIRSTTCSETSVFVFINLSRISVSSDNGRRVTTGLSEIDSR
jgi:hypothetical protein